MLLKRTITTLLMPKNHFLVLLLLLFIGMPNTDHNNSSMLVMSHPSLRDHGDHSRNRSDNNNNIAASTTTNAAAAAVARNEREDDGVHRLLNDTDEEYFIELLVMADDSMQSHHQHALESFVHSVVNMTAAIFQHESLGASVHVILQRFIPLSPQQQQQLLGRPSLADFLSSSYEHAYESFCRENNRLLFLQQRRNSSSKVVVVPDVTVLLTRHALCRNDYYERNQRRCILGRSSVGAICSERRSCAFVRDIGLPSTAAIFAHELGHLLGMCHDEDWRCENEATEDGAGGNQKNPFFMMKFNHKRPPPSSSALPWVWSPCSRYMLRRFFDEYPNNSRCIRNKPVVAATAFSLNERNAFKA